MSERPLQLQTARVSGPYRPLNAALWQWHNVGVEDVSIFLDHAIAVPQTTVPLATNMHGCLTEGGSDDNCIVMFDKDGSSAITKGIRHRSRPVFYLSELLEALHISLTDINQADIQARKRSFRKSGTVIGINLHYSNVDTFDVNYYKYWMRPTHYDSVYFRDYIEHVFSEDSLCSGSAPPARCAATKYKTYPDARYVLKRSGILIVFTATGEVGREFL